MRAKVQRIIETKECLGEKTLLEVLNYNSRSVHI